MIKFKYFFIKGFTFRTLPDRKDRMSMYWGLEMRVPFCDHRVVEYTYNMPWHLKSLHGREKGILREAFADQLPGEITWRKKSPYPKTHNPAYFAYVAAAAEGALADKSCFLGEMVNQKKLEEIKQNPDGIKEPWYGQLMRAPQIFAYLLQIYEWARKYRVELV
jgi:asparagine synthase (glutamine-hydrolysing)